VLATSRLALLTLACSLRVVTSSVYWTRYSNASIVQGMQDTTETFGQRVRRLRLLQAYSQRDLAARAGISEAAIIRIERETHTARPSTVRKIARALGVRPVQLTTGDG